ncbi:MAG TPA: hypothetical protein VGL37_06235 [Solirubrobacteraceae bacterium]
MRKIVATPLSLLLGIGLMLVVVLVSGATALAGQERPYTGLSFGPEGTGAGLFAAVGGVAVDQLSGDVFVYADSEGGRVYKFSATGEPVDFASTGTNVIAGVGAAGAAEGEIAVDSSSGPDVGDIYVANNSEVRIYSAAGSSIGTLSGGEMCGVAVDASGSVYVGIYPETARKYVPAANPVTNQSEVASMKGLQGVCNVAADGEGNLYAATYSGGITRYEALQFGSPVASGTSIDAAGNTLAVDSSTGDLYVNERDALAEYNAGGNPLGRSGADQLRGSLGVAIDNAKNDLYVPSNGRVIAFGPSVLLPTVSSGAASEVASSSAMISGSVNPEGMATTYQFQYGTSESYGSLAPATPQSVGSDSTTHELSAHLTGLSPGVEYHYRLLAINANGTGYGQDLTFKTNGPPGVAGESASKEAQSSVVVGAYIEPDGLDTRYQVEYGTSESYGSITAPAGAGIQAGHVSEELKGLQPDTVYHYRFVVANGEGTAHGPDETVSTTVAVRITGESVSGAANTEVTLKAGIEDFGAPSTYYFEYGPTSSYGSTTPEEILSREAQTVLEGLATETTYHFRVVTKNQFGVVDGEDSTFTTAPVPSLILPDDRRYEKVSPNANANGNVMTVAPTGLATEGNYTRLPVMAAADGNAVTYIGAPSEAGGTGREGTGSDNQYLSRRSPNGGWVTENITPASSESGDIPEYQAFTEDLTTGFLLANGNHPLVPGVPAEGYGVLYKRTLSTGPFEPLFTVKPPNRGPEEFTAADIPTGGGSGSGKPAYAGSSKDLSHVLFMANDALTPNAVDGGQSANNLYDSHDGALTLVNVLPDGSTEPNATFGGPEPSYDGPGYDAPSFSHDISEDGRRIFWTDLNNGNLYLREDENRTVQIDAGVGGGGVFWTATADGSEVLFTKAGDIYEYEVESGKTKDLVQGAEAQGVVGTSEDLTYIYFVADAALTTGAEHQECVPFNGYRSETTTSCNLYVLHQGEPLRFIAKLSPIDNDSIPQSFYESNGDWQPGMGSKEAEVSPDGRHLVFGSVKPLTGYESRETEEVFTYDYGSARILCASCNPTGEAPAHAEISAFLPVSRMDTYTPRSMSADGTRVFFDSLDALVPQDTNGRVDVYEWEQDGAGSCTRAQGCIYLLSAGSSPESSWLLDTSESGDDVFIETRSQLTSEDQNENVDVYDVRANAPLPPVQPQCSGTGCQGVPAPPPVFATPSSVTYSGVGNFPPAPTAAGKAKKPKAKKQQKKHKRKAKKHKREAKKQRKGSRRQAKKPVHKSVKSHGRSK